MNQVQSVSFRSSETSRKDSGVPPPTPAAALQPAPEGVHGRVTPGSGLSPPGLRLQNLEQYRLLPDETTHPHPAECPLHVRCHDHGLRDCLPAHPAVLSDIHEHHTGRMWTAGEVHRTAERTGLVEREGEREGSALRGDKVRKADLQWEGCWPSGQGHGDQSARVAARPWRTAHT